MNDEGRTMSENVLTAAEVAALRELCKQLPSYCPCRAIQGLADDECIQEHNAHCATTLKERVLADTEAAAKAHDARQWESGYEAGYTLAAHERGDESVNGWEATLHAHDQRLRLEGAREFVAFGGSLVDWEASGFQTFKEWRADMEADQP